MWRRSLDHKSITKWLQLHQIQEVSPRAVNLWLGLESNMSKWMVAVFVAPCGTEHRDDQPSSTSTSSSPTTLSRFLATRVVVVAYSTKDLQSRGFRRQRFSGSSTPVSTSRTLWVGLGGERKDAFIEYCTASPGEPKQGLFTSWSNF